MSNPAAEIFDSAAPVTAGRSRPGSTVRAWCRAWHRVAGGIRCALPQSCALCAAPCGGSLLCAACSDALPRLAHPCPCCALPTQGGAVCGHCARRRPPWSHAYAAFAYAYPLDRVLHAFKYRGALAYAPLLAHALAHALAHPLAHALAHPLAQGVRTLPDAIVPLPLADSRQRARGYNQAAEIARPLARSLQVPLLPALARTRDTPALAALPWRERQRGVAGAFTATMPLRGRTLAIVDDVLTTGSTLRAATLALIDAGAARVDVWVVARALPPE